MIDHLSTYATDFPKSKAFYTTAFEPLGYSIQLEFVAEWNTEFPTQRLCAFGPTNKPVYWIIETRVKHTPRHVAFSADSRLMVDNFYRNSITCGGTDNGEPGLRPMYHEHYYAAFVTDPDGNNVEAVCHVPD